MQSYSQRPHGPSRFSSYDDIKIQQRDGGQKIYYFDITEEKREYWMPKKKSVVDVFSWDTLSKESVMEPWIFRIRNKTDHPLFVTDILNTSNDVFMEPLTSRIKIDSNEYLELLARVNPLKTGHFYTDLKIKCLHPTGEKEFKVRQWGFRDEIFSNSISSADSIFFKEYNEVVQMKLTDPFKVYISDGDFNLHQNLSLTIQTGEKTIYPKKEVENEETYFVIDLDRKLWDTLFLQVKNGKGSIIAKNMLENRKFKDSQLIIFAFPDKWEVPYNFAHSYPQPFEPLKYVYQLTYNYGLAKKHNVKDINTYLKSNGIMQQVDSRGFVFFSNFEEALQVDRKLAKLNYQIKLLPVFHYSTLDQNGWGGECSWLSDRVGVYFYASIPHKRRMEILKSFDFLHTHKSYGSNDLVYYIRIGRVLDREYLKQLNQIYQLTEVKSIHQQQSGYTGLD